MAITKYTNVKVVGLCHQINAGTGIVSTLTNIDRKYIDVRAWGINHFTWMVDIKGKRTGENLYPPELFTAQN